jgi:hypothetical protein
MSKIENSINLLGTIAPINTEDTYPTHWAKYGKGGYVSVPIKEDIPSDRLEDGMRVYETTSREEFIVRLDSNSSSGYSFEPYVASNEATINRQSEIVDITDTTKVLSLQSAYFQFINPGALIGNYTPTLVLPYLGSAEFFEVEIINTSETNTLQIQEQFSNNVTSDLLTLGINTIEKYRALYCAWNGVEWAIWIRGFYQPN